MVCLCFSCKGFGERSIMLAAAALGVLFRLDTEQVTPISGCGSRLEFSKLHPLFSERCLGVLLTAEVNYLGEDILLNSVAMITLVVPSDCR